MNLRQQLPELAPTTVANMTAPVLKEVANRFERDLGEARRSNSGEAPSDLPQIPHTLVLSGLLPPEVDELVAAFAPWGLAEAERRIDGDWAAPLLRAAT
jgi:hypothetical protein